jgi:AcrR family transcriptional regulator
VVDPVATPATDRGKATRQALLDAAESLFGTVGYDNASVSEITRTAGVAQGTFYVYFADKRQAFSEVVAQVNRTLRRVATEGAAGAPNRIAAEAGGFRAYFDYVDDHPEVYRIIRDAEFSAPEAALAHYEAWAGPYAHVLAGAQAAGEIVDGIDPDLLAHLLMGVGEFFGQRLDRWDDTIGRDEAIRQVLLFVERGLAA